MTVDMGLGSVGADNLSSPGALSSHRDGGQPLVFVKLGGSVITDKGQPETARPEVIARLAGEIAQARASRPDLLLVLGHGSGSFGHITARRYDTHQGVHTPADWLGFSAVAAVAARLNRLITDHFLEAGVPVWSLQPSASALCRGGQLVSLALAPIQGALARGLIPLLYGDVALDEQQGGTIISTEQIFAFLAHRLHPDRLVLVGAVDGVFDRDPLRDPSARRIREITPANWQAAQSALGASHAPDVTGGMRAKVEQMVELVRKIPSMKVHLISGERPGALADVLLDPDAQTHGTTIHWPSVPPAARRVDSGT